MNYDTPDYSKQPQEMTEAESETARDARLVAEVIAQLDARKESEREKAQMPRQEESGTLTIDLVELFYFLLSKLHVIILGAVIGGVLMGIYTAATSVAVYTATAKLYIVGNSGVSIITDLQIGSVLSMDYQEVFNTWEVHQMVNETLGTDYSYSQLQSMISVDMPDSTRILYIRARHTDPQMAADIANAYATAAKRFITQVMDTDEPSTFSIALVPSVPQKASVSKSIIIGILAGTMLVCGIYFLMFILDSRPKSAEDIMRVAGIPTLAVIPEKGLITERSKKKKSSGRSKRK